MSEARPDDKDMPDLNHDGTTLSERNHVWNVPVLPAQPSSLGRQLKVARAKARSRNGTAEEPVRQRTRSSSSIPPPDIMHQQLQVWFASRGWHIFNFQREVWAHAMAGRNGLLHATTGSGKTWAAWGAALLAAAQNPHAGLRVLWITPMRALAQDTMRALSDPLAALGVEWEVGMRTSDTSAAERTRQRERLPEALVTTPESLSLMLSYADAQERLQNVAAIVVDEWHELLGNKRGVQVQLALARLRRWNPQLLIWGLSATLGDLEHARKVLAHDNCVLVRGAVPKALRIDSLLPHSSERFPA